MSKKFLRVRAVPGRRIIDPTTLGRSTPRFIGHQVVASSERTQVNWFTKEIEPAFDLVLTNEPALVAEPSPDGFFRRAILDGDLEYIETVERVGETEKTYVDQALKKASDAHLAAQEPSA
jgi:hypothetical protein